MTLTQLETEVEEYNLKWQEKVFSLWEMQRYSDAHNCLSDTELNYNEMLNTRHFEHSKIFTYIHEDYHLPLPGDLKNIKSKLEVPNLTSCLEALRLNENVGRMFGEDTVSLGYLFKSEEDIREEKEQWIAMHVVFDNSEYNKYVKGHFIIINNYAMKQFFWDYLTLLPGLKSCSTLNTQTKTEPFKSLLRKTFQ